MAAMRMPDADADRAAADAMARIHPTALVDPKAELAADVEVGAYSIVGPHVTIGAGTVIGPHVVAHRTHEPRRAQPPLPVHVDRRDPAGPQVRRRADDDDDRRRQRLPRVRDRSTPAPRRTAATRAIGNGNLFLAYTHVAHDCVVGNWHDVLEQCADRRPRAHRRLGRAGRVLRRPSVLPRRRARDDRRRRDRAAGRAAVRHGVRAIRPRRAAPTTRACAGADSRRTTSSRSAAPTRRSTAKGASLDDARAALVAAAAGGRRRLRRSSSSSPCPAAASSAEPRLRSDAAMPLPRAPVP